MRFEFQFNIKKLLRYDHLYIERKLVTTEDNPTATLRSCNGGLFFKWNGIGNRRYCN